MRLTKKGGQDMDTLKILVVDDESRMRKLVKDFLTKKNFQVLEAGDGEEAMDIFYKGGLRQPNSGEISRKVGRAGCGNDFSNTL